MNGRIKLGQVLFIVGRHMARIERHCKIWTAAFLVNPINWLIYFLLMRANGRNQMTACRKPQHPDLVRVNFPVSRVMPDQTQRSLGILQCGMGLWNNTDITDSVPVGT